MCQSVSIINSVPENHIWLVFHFSQEHGAQYYYKTERPAAKLMQLQKPSLHQFLWSYHKDFRHVTQSSRHEFIERIGKENWTLSWERMGPHKEKDSVPPLHSSFIGKEVSRVPPGPPLDFWLTVQELRRPPWTNDGVVLTDLELRKLSSPVFASISCPFINLLVFE